MNLFDSVIEFLNEHKHPDLAQSLTQHKHSIAYLTDIFTKFNVVNKTLQGDNVTIIKAKSTMATLSGQFTMFKQRLGKRVFSDFPCVANEVGVTDDELLTYCDHLGALVIDIKTRFKDLINLKIEDWVFDPFMDINNVEEIYQNELIALQNDDELKPKFKKSYFDFWMQPRLHEQYPVLWGKVQVLFVGFPTSYLVERGFSAVSLLLSKQRQRLMIQDRGDLRLLLTKMSPDIAALAAQHQAKDSHCSSMDKIA